MRTAEQHLADALEFVESESIREWVNTDRNRPIWLKLAQAALDHKGSCADAEAFSAYIVCCAIEL